MSFALSVVSLTLQEKVMKNFILLLSLVSFGLFTTNAMAEGYWGVKGASVNVDSSGYSSSLNIGAFIGADFTEIGSNPVALEFDYTTKLIDGKVSGLNWSAQTTAVFAAMRTGKEGYLKVKLGLHSSTTNVNGATGSGNGLAYGLGFGLAGYEIEYTIFKGETSSDTDINMLSVAYMF